MKELPEWVIPKLNEIRTEMGLEATTLTQLISVTGHLVYVK